MFDQMPNSLKEQVYKYLKDDDFQAAKKLYDQWHHEQRQVESQPISMRL